MAESDVEGLAGFRPVSLKPRMKEVKHEKKK